MMIIVGLILVAGAIYYDYNSEGYSGSYSYNQFYWRKNWPNRLTSQFLYSTNVSAFAHEKKMELADWSGEM